MFYLKRKDKYENFLIIRNLCPPAIVFNLLIKQLENNEYLNFNI